MGVVGDAVGGPEGGTLESCQILFLDLYECSSLEVVLIWLFVYRYRKVEVYLPPVARPLVTTACCAMIWTQRIEYVDCLKESAPRNAVGDAKL